MFAPVLNHLDIQVDDVPAAASFFVEHFGFAHVASATSTAIAILAGGGGFSLVIQKKKSPDERYPEGFHLGFLLDDRAAVMAFQARARDAGLSVSDVIENNRGTLTYCRTPFGLLVEVSCRPRAAQ